MTALLRILAGLGLLAGAVVLIGFMLPHRAHVERSAVIPAPRCEVYGVLDSFRVFDRWSPWADKDPQMKVRLSGPPAGAGAYYDWSGNKSVGSGTQHIVATAPDTSIDLDLKFSGFDGASQVRYTLEPDGDNTRVTWAMDTTLGSNPLAPYFGLLMDYTVGPDFEAGLARLKAYVEQQPKLDCAALGVRLIDNAPLDYGFLSGTTTTDPEAISKALDAAYQQIGKVIKDVGLEVKGPPIAITRRWDEEAKVYSFDAGLPVAHPPPSTADTGDVKFARTKPGLTLRFEHKGPYSDFAKLYAGIDDYKKLTGLETNGDSWEEYLSDPAKTPAAEQLTRIYVPVK